MCDNLTYRSAGAETLVRMDTINILLRWSKEGVLGYVGTVFVQLNSPDEPISYIRTHVILHIRILAQQMTKYKKNDRNIDP